MRQLLAVLLTLLFVWNSVPGGAGAVVLCFHPEGEAHVELVENSSESSPCCSTLENPADSSHCAACYDLVLEPVDLRSVRPNEVSSVDVPEPSLVNLSDTLTEAIFRPGAEPAVPYPTRGPPEAESLSLRIGRMVVLLL